MQQCLCDNTYKYPEKGKWVCVICGTDWPEDFVPDTEAEALAKVLYFKHLNVNRYEFAHLWDEAGSKIWGAWLIIAEDTLERNHEQENS